ncbi:MAG: hypothetical protein GEV00_18910 [Actinophytocola sp.]|nr:hypothetical protein [Actinophytocola sp.]
MPRLWPLAGVAGVVIVLGAVGAVPVWSGMPHLAGLPPLDVYSDLRVLLIGAESWAGFSFLLTVVVTARVIVLALLLGGLDRHRIGFAAAFYLLALLPLAAAAQLSYLGFTVLYARLFWAAVVIVVVLVVLLGATPWQGETRLRAALRRSWRWPRAWPLLGYAVAIALVSAAAETWPAATLPLVAVSALLTAVTIRLLARPPRQGAMPRLAAALTATAVIVAGTLATTPDADPGTPSPRAGSLLLMSGINSSSGNGAVFAVDPAALGYRCAQVYYYSYAGRGDGAPGADATCPIRTGAPFRPVHTHQAPADLAATFAEQARELPRPVVVLAHSNSAWVAWFGVSRAMAAEVDALVLLGAFPESAHGYLDTGERAPGRVASDLLRLLAPAAGRFGFHFDADAPVFREVLGSADAPARIMARPLPPDVRAISIVPATDVPLLPSGWRLPVEYNACPVWHAHPRLPATGAVWREINRFLDGKPEPQCQPFATWLATVSRPFGVP